MVGNSTCLMTFSESNMPIKFCDSLTMNTNYCDRLCKIVFWRQNSIISAWNTYTSDACTTNTYDLQPM